ncbi:hypothetical protein [Vibrio owensii]|uniref:hypothetical protein n=1 Tax=Vibrio owensii TaxID=696485 RepID=UPI003D9FEF8B
MIIVDKTVFLECTGVEFESDKGLFFRQLAIKSLFRLKADIEALSIPTKDLSHRLKGIIATCCTNDGVYLCKKLEQYDELIKRDYIQYYLRKFSETLIDQLK